MGALSSIVAGSKEVSFIKKHQKAAVILMTAAMVIAGLTTAYINKSVLDLFSLTGVLLHTSAFYLNSEKIIRRVSLLGSPFWFVYNFLSRAYGSAIGDILTMCSILIAMFRHRNAENTDKE